jgi:ubiquinone/menaquinone biosynthesis C-methylase UbiE
VYDLNGKHSEFSLTISLPTKLIFIYSIRKVKNRKRSLRRALRWLKKGGVTIREHSSVNVSSKYRSIYLTKDDLTKILGMERKELRYI